MGWMAGVQILEGARFFSLAKRSDRFWDPSSLLSNGYGRALSLGVKLINHLHLVPRSKKVSYIPSLHVFMLN
jgi:hypothetical protein